MVIGEKIRIARIRENLSVKELAERVGCSETAIYNYENSKSTPRKSILEKISKVFDIENIDSPDVTSSERIKVNSKTIGTLVQFYRREKLMSQKKLSDSLNVDTSYISKIENGHINILSHDNVLIKEKLFEIFPNLESQIIFIDDGNVIINNTIIDKQENLIECIKSYCTKNNITYKDLSFQIGASVNYISKLIRRSNARKGSKVRNDSLKYIIKLSNIIPEIKELYKQELEEISKEEIDNSTEEIDNSCETISDLSESISDDIKMLIFDYAEKCINTSAFNKEDLSKLLGWISNNIINTEILNIRLKKNINKFASLNLKTR